MKDRNFLAVLVISAASCLLFYLSFIFPMPVLAQSHAGHNAQPPMVEKPGRKTSGNTGKK